TPLSLHDLAVLTSVLQRPLEKSILARRALRLVGGWMPRLPGRARLAVIPVTLERECRHTGAVPPGCGVGIPSDSVEPREDRGLPGTARWSSRLRHYRARAHRQSSARARAREFGLPGGASGERCATSLAGSRSPTRRCSVWSTLLGPSPTVAWN